MFKPEPARSPPYGLILTKCYGIADMFEVMIQMASGEAEQEYALFPLGVPKRFELHNQLSAMMIGRVWQGF